MEWWLISHDNKQKIRLPVPPADYVNETGTTINIVDINDFGEYSIKGERKLDRINIKTFFPLIYNSSYCQYRNFKKPYDYVKTILSWKNNDKPCRLMITQTNINKLFDIENFSYGEKAGSRDVEFELSLIEKRTITIPKPSKKKATPKKKRPAGNHNKPKTHKVVKGDTLWALARKFYDDPYKWTTIAKKNGVKNPRLLQIGKVLIIP